MKLRVVLIGIALFAIGGCGGGGSGGGASLVSPPPSGGGGNPAPPPPDPAPPPLPDPAPPPPAPVPVPTSGWVSGVFRPASDFEGRCAVPRVGTEPITGRAYPDVLGTTLTEKNWLRSWSNDLYLWYGEIVDADPEPYTVLDYFDRLKTTATTLSGGARDRFHFTYPTSEWEQLSQAGVSVGYGASWSIVPASTAARVVVVAYTEPNSPATSPSAALVRGAYLKVVDGVDAEFDMSQAGIDILNAALFPTAPNESHTFTVLDPGNTVRTFTMTSDYVTSTPVQNVKKIATKTGDVGYILFNDHIATAEQQLIDAVNTLNAGTGITDLVLDIRYNGGGYLVIASELAYMIAGAQSVGKTFEALRFNSKHPTIDPVTGRRLAPVQFQTTAVGLSASSGQPLPTLNLPRVFVLTGSTTCSASESIINALDGIGVEVIQIGSTTCGKPYGFYPQDNCGTTYFTVEFKGENAMGFGDYPDGFSPANTRNITGAPNPGCSVRDDFAWPLGDPGENRLRYALSYRNSSGGCPGPTGLAPNPGVAEQMLPSPPDGIVIKPEWLQNRIMLR